MTTERPALQGELFCNLQFEMTKRHDRTGSPKTGLQKPDSTESAVNPSDGERLSENKDEPLITIGRVIKEWGLQGELLVEPLTFNPDRFLELKEATFSSGGRRDSEKTITRRIFKSVRRHGKLLVLGLEGVGKPEEARQYRGFQIQVRRSESPELPEDVYYHYDIIGLRVSTADGMELGTISSILETGSNDIYVVRGADKEHLLPATKKVVRNIDLKAREMMVTLSDIMEE